MAKPYPPSLGMQLPAQRIRPFLLILGLLSSTAFAQQTRREPSACFEEFRQRLASASSGRAVPGSYTRSPAAVDDRTHQAFLFQGHSGSSSTTVAGALMQIFITPLDRERAQVTARLRRGTQREDDCFLRGLSCTTTGTTTRLEFSMPLEMQPRQDQRTSDGTHACYKLATRTRRLTVAWAWEPGVGTRRILLTRERINPSGAAPHTQNFDTVQESLDF
jgi:hypothetical protein